MPENQRVSIPTGQQQTGTTTSSGTRPEWPSDRVKAFENSVLRIEHPDNWQAYGQGDIAATIAPDKGLVDDGRGNQALAYGVIVNMYEPTSDQSITSSSCSPKATGSLRDCPWKMPRTG